MRERSHSGATFNDERPSGQKEHRMHLRRPATALAAATICVALGVSACGSSDSDDNGLGISGARPP